MRYDLKTATTLGEPLGSPVTIAEAGDTLRVDDVNDSAEVARQLLAATAYCEGDQHRTYLTSSWLLYLDCFPVEIIIADHLPIASIVAITYTDAAGDEQTVSADDYQTDIVSENKPARIMPVSGQVWPTTATDVYNAVKVEFTAGWTTTNLVPDAIKQAIKLQTLIGFDIPDDRQMAGVIMARDAMLGLNDWGQYN